MRKISSVTRNLSTLIAIAAASASVQKANSKEQVALWLVTCFKKPNVPGSSPAASYAQK